LPNVLQQGLDEGAHVDNCARLVASLERVPHVDAVRGSAALDGVMRQQEGGTAGCLSMVEPRAARLEIFRPRSFQDRAACYHFATQLAGTR
jgi:hypothetical protein